MFVGICAPVTPPPWHHPKCQTGVPGSGYTLFCTNDRHVKIFSHHQQYRRLRLQRPHYLDHMQVGAIPQTNQAHASKAPQTILIRWMTPELNALTSGGQRIQREPDEPEETFIRRGRALAEGGSMFGR